MKIMILAYHIEVICVRSVEDLDTIAVLEEGITRVQHVQYMYQNFNNLCSWICDHDSSCSCFKFQVLELDHNIYG